MKSNNLFLISIVLILALKQIVALGAASRQMSIAQQHNINDVTLICTGSEMKWVSISQTHALGEFVYISPDQLNVELPTIVDCTNEVQGDNINGVELFPSLHLLISQHQYTQKFSKYQSPYSAFSYLTRLVRGPPVSIT